MICKMFTINMSGEKFYPEPNPESLGFHVNMQTSTCLHGKQWAMGLISGSGLNFSLEILSYLQLLLKQIWEMLLMSRKKIIIM